MICNQQTLSAQPMNNKKHNDTTITDVQSSHRLTRLNLINRNNNNNNNNTKITIADMQHCCRADNASVSEMVMLLLFLLLLLSVGTRAQQAIVAGRAKRLKTK